MDGGEGVGVSRLDRLEVGLVQLELQMFYEL